MSNTTVIITGSIVFAALWLISAIILLIVTGRTTYDDKLKSEYRIMSFTLTFLGAFCMWLMWVSVYMHQMNPLIEPVVKAEA